MSNAHRIVAALGAIALLPAALVACSGGGNDGTGGAGGSSQSVDEACALITDEIDRIDAEMTDTAESLDPSDMDGALDALGDILTQMRAVSAEVTNEEVGPHFETLIDGTEQSLEALDGFGASMPDVEDIDMSDPDQLAEYEAAMEEWAAAMEEQAGDLETVTADIEHATGELEELCGFSMP